MPASPEWRRKISLGLALRQLSLSAGLIFAGSPAAAAPIALSDFGQLALRCAPNAAPSTLASIAKTESGFDPLTVSDNTTGTTVAFPSGQMASRAAAALIASGDSVDVGLMQINSANLRRLGLSVDDVLDPCGSLKVAAYILAADYAGGDEPDQQQAALRVALSRYNTGDARRGFENGYVRRVELAAKRVIPALDVAPEHPVVQPVASAPMRDPNAPPAWDVWSNFDYAAARGETPGAGDRPAAPGPSQAKLQGTK